MISGSLLLYLTCEIISLLVFYVSIKLKRKNKALSLFFLLIATLPFIFLVSFRAGSVGTDYGIYNWAYNIVIKNDPFAHEWLGLFFYVFKLLSITNSYQITVAIINSIIVVLFFIAAYRHKESPVMVLATIFAFCLHLQVFNQFRQSLALALCLLNIENVRKNNKKRFIILQFLAAIAHTTSLIFIPVLFLRKVRFSKKSVFIYAIAACVVFVFSSFFMKILLVTNYGQRYFGGSFDFAAESSMKLLIIRMIMFCGVLVLGKISEKKNELSLLYHMAAICTIIQIVAAKSYIFARLTTYYYLSYVFLIPELVVSLRIKKKQKILLFIGLFLLLLIYKITYYQTMGPGAGIDNYKLIWSN